MQAQAPAAALAAFQRFHSHYRARHRLAGAMARAKAGAERLTNEECAEVQAHLKNLQRNNLWLKWAITENRHLAIFSAVTVAAFFVLLHLVGIFSIHAFLDESELPRSVQGIDIFVLALGEESSVFVAATCVVRLGALRWLPEMLHDLEVVHEQVKTPTGHRPLRVFDLRLAMYPGVKPQLE